MKKILVLTIIAIILSAGSVYAVDLIDNADVANVEISTVIDPEYIITIPNNIKINTGDNGFNKLDIELSKKIIEPGATINVRIKSTAHNFRLSNGLSDIPYKIYRAANTSSPCSAGDVVATFNSSTVKGQIASCYAKVIEWNMLSAGTFKDNLTFSLEYIK